MNLKRIQDPKKRLRVYADTSVFGGCFDEEFAKDSSFFFKDVKAGKILLVTSEILLFELKAAPPIVRQVLNDLPPNCLITLKTTEEMLILRDAYISAGVLPRSAQNDAAHIASATIAEAEMLVSWNFKHVVHYDKIRGFNAVNLLKGYPPIQIYSPKEVITI